MRNKSLHAPHPTPSKGSEHSILSGEGSMEQNTTQLQRHRSKQTAIPPAPQKFQPGVWEECATSISYFKRSFNFTREFHRCKAAHDWFMFWSPKLMPSSLTTGLWDLNICRNIALPSQCDTEKCILTTHFLILLWTKTDEGGGRAVLQQTTSEEVRVMSSCPWVTTPPQHSAPLLGLFVEDTFWFSPYMNHLTMCFDVLRTPAFDPFPNIKVHFALRELPPACPWHVSISDWTQPTALCVPKAIYFSLCLTLTAETWHSGR